MLKFEKLPQLRRHSYFFLQKAKETCPVYLSIEITMSCVKVYRENHAVENNKISYIAFLIHSISKIYKKYPMANSVITGWLSPKIAVSDMVIAKFPIDTIINGKRVVVAGYIPDSDKMSLNDIQNKINDYKKNSPERESDLKVSTDFNWMYKLPFIFNKWIYKFIVRNPAKREKMYGTFVITSLGHRPIKQFFPMGNNVMSFGVGAIRDVVVMKENQMTSVPILELCMVFDHRLLDGATAADILTDIKSNLESDYK